jgi:hypothetical protein
VKLVDPLSAFPVHVGCRYQMSGGMTRLTRRSAKPL